MIMDERDELIERAARSLAVLPPANPVAVLEILSAVRARRVSRVPLAARFAGWMRTPSFSVASATMLAAATLVIGFVSGGVFDRAATSVERPAAGARTMTLTPAADVAAESRAVAVPLVFDAPGAKAVTVVGDFNDWDPTVTPMQRFGGDGPWTATVLAKPGRHVYAFVVDGVLSADPRAPKTRDLDYGGEASVLMVTKP
jgi:hypothetical protein